MLLSILTLTAMVLVSIRPLTLEILQDAAQQPLDYIGDIFQDQDELNKTEEEKSKSNVFNLWSNIEAAFRFLEERQIDSELRQKIQDFLQLQGALYKDTKLPFVHHNFVRFGKRFAQNNIPSLLPNPNNKRFQKKDLQDLANVLLNKDFSDKLSYPKVNPIHLISSNSSNEERFGSVTSKDREEANVASVRKQGMENRKTNRLHTHDAANLLKVNLFHHIEKRNNSKIVVSINKGTSGFIERIFNKELQAITQNVTQALLNSYHNLKKDSQFRQELLKVPKEKVVQISHSSYMPQKKSAKNLATFGPQLCKTNGGDTSDLTMESMRKLYKPTRFGRMPANVFYRSWLTEPCTQYNKMYPMFSIRPDQNILPKYG